MTELPTLAPAVARSRERRGVICSAIGLTVKFSLALLAGVSLVRLAGAYQERMERQGELSAVLDLERAKLAKARERFDHLFMVDGEQRLIREQNRALVDEDTAMAALVQAWERGGAVALHARGLAVGALTAEDIAALARRSLGPDAARRWVIVGDR